ncbi:5-demethoxyubiquinol-8 5-hydroxylase UbiM [Moraxella nonliquefaciens]|uniref:5-demethoxyubiquinol-8 5-hydroxylase UbiM n=1 Tax=Moraxella nonliquefaciens TaxID=478 RepID=UPI0024A62E77|nr:5-demethoxyubiquinol-8 5-hydroxylase UbiM [Moraxella nonliquefaciens]MDI4497925.1 5-demethoxyubiquinol-8 5-hydroxylase UbiM [Moraxella nonliquefaciens]MDI4499688.1 5-demethoxyubiquinol-8 5-hydroxylase UbiM [Moraxella nonliquefaciens]
MNTTHSDIIIIGAGPAGLAFSRHFKGTDLTVTIIEKSPLNDIANPAYDGREIALTHRSREIMLDLGAWQRMADDEIYKLADAKVYNGDFNYALHFKVPKDLKLLSSIDRLGNLISNHNIRQAFYDEVKDLPNVNILTEQSVLDIKTNNQKAEVILADGRTLSANLLIGADSRLSFVRKKLGIGAEMNDFGRTVIVFRVSHPLSNEATARECFLHGRTLALLPLHEHLTNCVITLDNTQANSLLAMTGDELALEVQRMMNDRLGKLTLAGTIHHYPLMGVHAKTFVSTRSALVGDSSVGMHPVTAHGFNLGIMGANTLATLILDAHAKEQDIASPALLQKYNIRHQAHTRPLYHGTNLMVGMFTDDSTPMQVVRDLTLRVSNHLPPVKRWIAGQLTGK